MNLNSFLHAFDLDYTLLNINCSFAFASFLKKKKIFSRLQYFYILYASFCFKSGIWSLKKLHQKVFLRLFYSQNSAKFEKEASEFFNLLGEKILNPSILSILNEIKRRGDSIMVLSSSPSFLVKKIATKLGIENVVATEYVTDSFGNFSSISSIVDGAKKADHLHHLLQKKTILKERIIAYSDSWEDLPFLEKAGRVVVVNPSKKLKRLASKNCWEIIIA